MSRNSLCAVKRQKKNRFVCGNGSKLPNLRAHTQKLKTTLIKSSACSDVHNHRRSWKSANHIIMRIFR